MHKNKLEKRLQNIKFGFQSGSFEEYLKHLKYLKIQIDEYISNPKYKVKKALEISLFKALYWSIEGERDHTKIHPSEINDFCSRRAYFKMLKVKQDEGFINTPPADLQKIFDYGSMVHIYIQFNLLRAGLIEDYEVPIRDEKFNITGIADAVSENCIWEIKTMNTWQFQKLKAPVEHHLKQATFYAHYLQKRFIVFIYLDKSSLKIKHFIVEPNRQFLQSFFNELDGIKSLIRQNFGRRRPTIDEILQKPMPERICKSRLDERALKCPFANTCFKS